MNFFISLTYSASIRGGCAWSLWHRASWDSGASWAAFHQAEHGLNETQLRGVHTAYSSLLPLNETHVGMVYERGPMGSRVGAGEYATIRWQAVLLPHTL